MNFVLWFSVNNKKNANYRESKLNYEYKLFPVVFKKYDMIFGFRHKILEIRKS